MKTITITAKHNGYIAFLTEDEKRYDFGYTPEQAVSELKSSHPETKDINVYYYRIEN